MKNILSIFVLITFQTAFAARQVSTCSILDDDLTYKQKLKDRISQRRVEIADLSYEEVERQVAIFIDEHIKQNGFLPGHHGERGEPRSFAELKAQGLRPFVSVYGTVGASILNLEQYLKGTREESPQSVNDRMPRYFSALMLHEYIQRTIVGQDAAASEATGFLLKWYIIFDESIGRQLRIQ